MVGCKVMLRAKAMTAAPRLVLLGFLAILLAPGGAWAGSTGSLALLEQAKELEEDVDFEGALAIYQRVLADESAPESHRALARLQAAYCLVALDRMDEAHTLLVEALIADPGYELPPYSSPKLSEAVDKARADAMVSIRRIEEERARQEAAATVAEVPAETSPPRRQRSLLPLSATVGTGALAAAGTGVYFGLSARHAEDRLRNDPSSFQSHREAMEYRDWAMGQARVANILYISGAVLAAGSGVLLILHRPEGSITAAPMDGGMILVASGRW